MIKRLIELMLDNTVFVNLVFFLLMAVGFFALLSLPMERYPNVQMGKVLVTAVYPGASPEDVERLVTREIEDAIEDLENVEYIQSTSYAERSSVLVKFIDDVDYETGYKELRFRVLGVLGELPEGVDPPAFTKIEVAEWLPAVSVNLVGDRSNRALSLMADEMKLALRRIPGVKEVELEGEHSREFHIVLDPERLIRYGVTFDDVVEAIKRANVSIPAGDFASATGGEFILRMDERLHNPEQVAQAVIRKDSHGSFVTVGDVLDHATMDYRDPYVIASVNGQPCVTLKVIKSPDGNVMDIVPAVLQTVDSFKPRLEREGVTAVPTQDQRIKVRDAVSTLLSNMVAGVVLVCMVLWMFLGFRNAMLASAGIPFSFLVTMVLMYAAGTSLNEITLFSFVLVSGIIVDDAIVVVENIHRHVQSGLPLRRAVVEGALEVFLPVVAATTTTCAAFLPMLIMSGSTGDFFAEIPKAVSAAIMASLIECLLILPSHFMDWPGAKRLAGHDGVRPDGRIISWLKRWTKRLVSLCLRARFLTLAAVGAGFVAAVAILGVSMSGKASLIRIDFFPDEYDYYYVELFGPTGAPIEEVSRRLREISTAIMGMGPGMAASCTAKAGFYVNQDYQAVFGRNSGNIMVETPVKEKRRFADYPANDPLAHLDWMRAKLARFSTDGFRLRIRREKGGPPAGKDLNVRVVGSNPESVRRLAASLMSWMDANPKFGSCLVNLGDNQGRPSQVFRFKPLARQTAEHGATPAQVGTLAASVLDGRLAGKFKARDEEVDLRVKLSPHTFDNPQDALDIPLFQHHAGPVRLGDVCTVESYLEPAYLTRYDGSREIAISADIKQGAPVGAPEIVRLVRERYRQIRDDFPGADVNFAGAFESTRRSYVSLAYAFAIAVFLIYMILATQFKSYAQPAIILSAIVFALEGVVFGAFFSRSVFTVNSFVATVGVAGVVVNDSLVLIDFINRAYRKGRSRREAIMEGVDVRLRPILLTTLTTTLGLAPMALGIPEYSLTWGSMAMTFVTGLCTATFLTIFVVPVLWDLLTAAQERFGKRRAAE
ncbi:MAG: efflux RND transporter permease subunit [Desulfovibrionaceae bacterium]